MSEVITIQTLNFVATPVAGGHFHLYFYPATRRGRDAAYNAIGRHGLDPEYLLSQFDASQLARKVREMG